MSTYLTEKISDGDSTVEIRIEVDDPKKDDAGQAYDYGPMRGETTRGETTRGRTKGADDGEEPSRMTRAFENGMALIRTCAKQVANTMREIDKAVSPDEVEVKFGVKLAGEAGAVVAKKKTEAHMEVTLKWNKPPKT